MGPVDILFLVESGLEFDQDRHLFARLSGLGQGTDDRGMPRDPVQRLPYRHNGGVRGRFFGQSKHGIIGFIRNMQEKIPPADTCENRLALFHRGAGYGRMRRKFELGNRQIREVGKSPQVRHGF